MFVNDISQHPNIIDILMLALNSEDIMTRQAAMQSLSIMGKVTTSYPEVISAVLYILNYDEKPLPSQAASVLGRMGEDVTRDPEVIPALLKAMGKEDRYLRSAAIGALSCMGETASQHQDVFPALITVLSDETDKEMRREAAVALGKLGQDVILNPNILSVLLESEQYTRLIHGFVLRQPREAISRVAETLRQMMTKGIRLFRDQGGLISGKTVESLARLS